MALTSRLGHSVTPNALRSYLAEFISTFLYVFAAVGAAMSSRRMMPDAASESSSLVAVAVANAFALSAGVFLAANISGGHLNPAVTFGMAVGGHISIPMSILYWISQMLGSVMACLLLRTATVGQHVPTHAIAPQMTGFGASLVEGVMTFTLVYTVYAAADTKRGPSGVIGPLMIGLIAGANILASGPFTGGSMNPAYSFGSALVGGSFKNQAVYWVGPLIGAAIAGLLYDNVVFPARSPDARGLAEGGV
ncbi:probable aquaporin TIP5-1 [Coffea arabica]|uniref:Probable aquaporin TIP5-1 n=1 Tax=Coffea arabica TaxID=13443 RepID=A0A6P6VIK2_COFAR|nr:probable aquaporin TIP5-1 [Coffea arabica]XP_027115601.1 probable aquaporin TIP5-1 [Coffea arabica]